MKRLFSTIVAMVAIVAPCAQAQQAEHVTVDGKNYAITSLSRGRMIQLTDTTNGQSAMLSVQGNSYTILSPPGGFYNGVDYGPTIKKVWDAYQAQKNEKTAANGNTLPVGQQPPSDDQAAALRAQNAALRAGIQARMNGVPANGQSTGPVAYEFPASGGAIAHGTPYGDIIFNADASEAHFTRTSSNALAGNMSQTWSYEYVGQKNKAGAAARGVGGALAGAMNVRHTGRVDEGGIEVYLQTNGGEKEHEYGTEQKTFAVNPNVRTPLDNGVRQLAIGFLDAAKEALAGSTQAAKEQNIQSFHPDDAVVMEFEKWKHKL